MKITITLTIVALFLIQAAITHSQTPIAMTGSVVVCVRTPSEIYVGADSKVVAFGTNTLRSMCKIRQLDNLFFASTGLISDAKNGEESGFNVEDIVTKAYKNNNSISETVQAFEQMIVGPFKTMLERFRLDQPDYYKRYIVGKANFDIIFFGQQNETLVVYFRYFNAKESPNGSISIDVQRQDFPDDASPTGTTYIFLGHHDAINNFLDSHPLYSRGELIPTILKLIEIEIADKPDVVGYPIDIIRVEKNGAEWIQHKPDCPDIKIKN